LSQLKSSFIDQSARVVCVVRPLQARSKIDGVADYRKGARVRCTDRADHQIAGGEAHPHTKLRQLAAQTKDTELAARFKPLAEALTKNEAKINGELIGAQRAVLARIMVTPPEA